MVEPAYGLACLKELDAMIGRAVAACSRYRQATEQWGLPAPLRRNRRKRLQTMEAMLARLLAQRANEVPGVVPWGQREGGLSRNATRKQEGPSLSPSLDNRRVHERRRDSNPG